MFLLKKLKFIKKLKPKSQSHIHAKVEPWPPPPICPWSERHLNILSSSSPSQFPHPGRALTATATASGELFLLGGFPPSTSSRHSAHNYLHMFSTRDLSVTLLQTSGEAPSPRFGHASALVSDDILIWGGATNTGDRGEFRRKGPHDDSLYLLNLESRKWTRVVVNGPGPEGRYYHAMTIVGSKLFVFGGEVDGKYLNDMWAIDLKSLKSNPVWDSYECTPGDEKPLPRAKHVLVTIGDRITLFGGSNSQCLNNGTWLFDALTRKWTQLQCTGHIPASRKGHAAAVVDDVMYVFGGRDVKNAYLGDMFAFKLSTQQWFRFQNTGPSPENRWRHSMASDGTQVFLLGGEVLEKELGDSNLDIDSALIYVFDTKHIKYPNPDPNAIEPSERATQLAQTSSPVPSTQEQRPHPTSSSSDTYVAHGASPFQEVTPDELGLATFPRITREGNPSSNGLPPQPTGVNSKPGCVPEENDGGKASTEYRAKIASSEAQSELERQLSVALAAQAERDRRLAQLADELALKSALLEQAEATAEAAKRAGMEHADRADRLLAQVEQKDAELAGMQAKKATFRASNADERSQHAGEQTGQYQTELAEVRAELEAVRLRLADAENGWAKSKTETDPVGTDEGQSTRGLMERLRAMEAEIASLRSSGKGSEAMQSRNEG